MTKEELARQIFRTYVGKAYPGMREEQGFPEGSALGDLLKGMLELARVAPTEMTYRELLGWLKSMDRLTNFPDHEIRHTLCVEVPDIAMRLEEALAQAKEPASRPSEGVPYLEDFLDWHARVIKGTGKQPCLERIHKYFWDKVNTPKPPVIPTREEAKKLAAHHGSFDYEDGFLDCYDWIKKECEGE